MDQTRQAQTLKALAHPVRMTMLQRLLVGPARVSELAQFAGIAPNSASFHLNQLEKYGLAARTERPVGAPGTERWWRAVDDPDKDELVLRLSSRPSDSEGADSGGSQAALILWEEYTRRFVSAAQAEDRRDTDVPAIASFATLALTTQEAVELEEALREVVSRFLGRELEGQRTLWSVVVGFLSDETTSGPS